MNNQKIHSLEITKNLNLHSNEKRRKETKSTFKLKETFEEKNLLLMMPWMFAQQKFVMPIVKFYLDKNFDVLVFHINVYQLMHPERNGVLFENLGEFLQENLQYSRIVSHVFSIGTYLASECFRQMDNNEKYGNMFDRFVGFIGDSMVDIECVKKSFVKYSFPNNPESVKLLNPIFQYFFNAYHDTVIIHFIRAVEACLNWKRMVPTLLFASRTDPLGDTPQVREIMDAWTSRGCNLTWKYFDDSPHVGHFFKYNDEYKKCLNEFLESLNLGKNSKDLKSKM